jgi:DNA end-binding protein Ku
MARPLWQGSISFGLVEIPAGIYPAESPDELSFRMLDKRDFSPIGYKRINKNTGKEVPWDEIIKAYETDKDEYVVLSDEELKAANVRATQTIEIIGFIDEDDVDPMFYDRPYYVGQTKKGSKAYALLRETLKRTRKVGLARVVIRTRQHLAVLRPVGDLLVLELLRFAHELRDPEEVGMPENGKAPKTSEAEAKMAERLVKEMEIAWEPEQYKDEYREDVLNLVKQKVKAGQQREIVAPAKEKAPSTRGQVVDLMSLLKKSVAQAGGGASEDGEERPARRPARAASSHSSSRSGGRSSSGRAHSRRRAG